VESKTTPKTLRRQTAVWPTKTPRIRVLGSLFLQADARRLTPSSLLSCLLPNSPGKKHFRSPHRHSYPQRLTTGHTKKCIPGTKRGIQTKVEDHMSGLGGEHHPAIGIRERKREAREQKERGRGRLAKLARGKMSSLSNNKRLRPDGGGVPGK